MDQRSMRGNDAVIDIDNGGVELSKDGALGSRHSEKVLDRVWDGFSGNVGVGGEGRSFIPTSCYSNSAMVSVAIEDSIGSHGDDKVGGEVNGGNSEKKQKKKNCKKPPKPPRPPKSPSLDEADQKLIREITELAMLRHARIERMKALKKMKNGKAASSSNVNVWAFIITVFFCVVIFWQGFYSKSTSDLGFQGSPVSSLGNNDGMISVQYYRNMHNTEASLSSTPSPNMVEQVSGSDFQDEPTARTRFLR